eukprot:TRINITY_DN963_c0_g1_i9.p1 TRINITY_DN963_c0_g1~~TRINITY_DN963_c0_g1_i9.p1  ORF type:complete len:729 (+),score=156.51 TRINITY_DN963_c0_g1_i9:3-2189(+)
MITSKLKLHRIPQITRESQFGLQCSLFCFFVFLPCFNACSLDCTWLKRSSKHLVFCISFQYSMKTIHTLSCLPNHERMTVWSGRFDSDSFLTPNSQIDNLGVKSKVDLEQIAQHLELQEVVDPMPNLVGSQKEVPTLQNRDLDSLKEDVNSFVEKAYQGWTNQDEKYPVFRFTNTSGLGKTRMVWEMATHLRETNENTCCAFVSYNLGNTLVPEETVGFEQAFAIRLYRSVFDNTDDILGENLAKRFSTLHEFKIQEVVQHIVDTKNPNVLMIGVDEVQMLGDHVQDILRKLIASGTAASGRKVPVVLAIAGTIPPDADYRIDPSKGVSHSLDLPLLTINNIETIIGSEIPESHKEEVMKLGGMARPIAKFAEVYRSYDSHVNDGEQDEIAVANMISEGVKTALQRERVENRLPKLDWDNLYHELFNTPVEDWPAFKECSVSKLVFARGHSGRYGSNNPIGLYTSKDLAISSMLKTPTALWQQFEKFTADHLALKAKCWHKAAEQEEQILDEMELSTWLSGATISEGISNSSALIQRPCVKVTSHTLQSQFPKEGQSVKEFFEVDTLEELCKKVYVNGTSAPFADVIGFYQGKQESKDVLIMECVQCKFGNSKDANLKNFQEEVDKVFDKIANLDSGWEGVQIVTVFGYISSRTTVQQGIEIHKHLGDNQDLMYLVSGKEARDFYGDCLLHSLDVSRFTWHENENSAGVSSSSSSSSSSSNDTAIGDN